MTTPPTQPDPDVVDPSDADVQAWADKERQRRAAWLEGPSPEQKAAWAQRERERRLAEQDDPSEQSLAERVLSTQRYARTAQLAGEGAWSLMWKLSRRGLEILIEEGRAWEDEFAPRRPRRVRLGDADPE